MRKVGEGLQAARQSLANCRGCGSVGRRREGGGALCHLRRGKEQVPALQPLLLPLPGLNLVRGREREGEQ